MKKDLIRCPWSGSDPLMIDYHDKEWGKPIHDDKKHFEFLILEAAQAGLSWMTILKRREGYRKLFANFDPEKVVRFGKKQAAAILKNPAVIRNRLKIEAAIHNSRPFLEIQEKFGSFDKYAWQFVDGEQIVNKWKTHKGLPPTSPQSDAFSKDLKQKGFKFVGSTVIYAHMQAIGMVNDHLLTCFCHKSCIEK